MYDRIEPIKVIDLDFNYKAQIDDYETLIVKRKWHSAGSIELYINANKQNVQHLKKGNLLLMSDFEYVQVPSGESLKYVEPFIDGDFENMKSENGVVYLKDTTQDGQYVTPIIDLQRVNKMGGAYINWDGYHEKVYISVLQNRQWSTWYEVKKGKFLELFNNQYVTDLKIRFKIELERQTTSQVPFISNLQIDINTTYVQNVVKTINTHKVGIINHVEMSVGENGEESETLVVIANMLSSIFSDKITMPPEGKAHHIMRDNVGNIMKNLVKFNCINPENPKRRIELLTTTPNKNEGQYTTFQTRLKQLDKELEKLSIMSGLGWNVSIDAHNKKWVFDVFTGVDRTQGQYKNPPVIFSLEFDSIKSQKYVDSELGCKNVAIVGGQGQGSERTIIEVGDTVSTGLERKEVFIDARDIENVNDLPSRGEQKLSEFQPIKSFDTEILTNSPFQYKKDWDLGDVVTVSNTKLNITQNRRITEVIETYDVAHGFTLEVTFGMPQPTLIQELKKQFDTPLIETGNNGGGSGGEGSGEAGRDGVGLEFNWRGTELGIKREDEVDYKYVNLKGEKGDKGSPGPQGPKGQKGDKGEDGNCIFKFDVVDGYLILYYDGYLGDKPNFRINDDGELEYIFEE